MDQRDDRKETSATVKDGVTVIRFLSRRILDEGQIQRIRKELLEHAEAAESRVLLNFGEVEFASSALRGVIMLAKKKCRASGKSLALALCCVPPVLMDVCTVRFDEKRKVELSCLTGAKLWMVFDSEDEALSRSADW